MRLTLASSTFWQAKTCCPHLSLLKKMPSHLKLMASNFFLVSDSLHAPQKLSMKTWYPAFFKLCSADVGLRNCSIFQLHCLEPIHHDPLVGQGIGIFGFLYGGRFGSSPFRKGPGLDPHCFFWQVLDKRTKQRQKQRGWQKRKHLPAKKGKMKRRRTAGIGGWRPQWREWENTRANVAWMLDKSQNRKRPCPQCEGGSGASNPEMQSRNAWMPKGWPKMQRKKWMKW